MTRLRLDRRSSKESQIVTVDGKRLICLATDNDDAQRIVDLWNAATSDPTHQALTMLRIHLEGQLKRDENGHFPGKARRLTHSYLIGFMAGRESAGADYAEIREIFPNISGVLRKMYEITDRIG